MADTNFCHSLFSCIQASPTPFHAADFLSRQLQETGFVLLEENRPWHLEGGGRYLVIRSGSVIAFTIGETFDSDQGFRIIGAHTDSPCLQIKPHPMDGRQPYFQFGVEKYGGAILSTWLDRELSLAGRVTGLTANGEIVTCLVDFQKPLLTIPSLAIHLDREANDGRAINAQTDLCPVLSQTIADADDWNMELVEQIRKQYHEHPIRSILGRDLFCYDCSPPRFLGIHDDFISAPRLDNLLSCFVGMTAIRRCRSIANCMFIFTNHEEIGSMSSAGALSNFASATLSRIVDDSERRAICLSRTFFLSLDNAHATHPNFQAKSDSDHEIILNKGPVIKHNSSRRYCSHGQSSALFRLLCSEVGVETQDFVMRSDLACGSTIGPLTTASLGIDGIDVGAATWAMHSIREVTGSRDPELLCHVAEHFFDRETFPVISKC
jgi:aspartyl aminopeptidase